MTTRRGYEGQRMGPSPPYHQPREVVEHQYSPSSSYGYEPSSYSSSNNRYPSIQERSLYGRRHNVRAPPSPSYKPDRLTTRRGYGGQRMGPSPLYHQPREVVEHQYSPSSSYGYGPSSYSSSNNHSPSIQERNPYGRRHNVRAPPSPSYNT